MLHAVLREGSDPSDELGMISPPQSPRVHPRSRAEGALGDLGGKKRRSDLFRMERGLLERPLRGDPWFAGVLLRSASDLVDHDQIAGFCNSWKLYG